MATPKLRFKEFDEKYKSILFKDIEGFSIKSGKSNGRKETGKYSFYGSTGLIGYKDDYDYTGEAILIARVGANAGSLYKVEGKYSVSDNTLMLSASANISLNYIRELLIKFNLNKLVFGTGQPLVTGGLIKKISVSVPKPEEQTKIATFLSAVDTKIDELIQKHELLSEYKKGMMQQLFSQKLRFKADDGSDFEDWKESKFSEFFTFHMTNSLSRAKLSEQGNVMNIHYGDIHTKFSTLFDTTKEDVSFIKNKTDALKIKSDQFLQIGDLIIADASEDYDDIGKTLEIINLDGKKAVAGLHTYIARPNQTYATGFCGYMMQAEKIRKQIKVLATGISVLGISKTNLNKLDLAMPSLPEQTKIASFLTAIDQKIDNIAEQIDHAKTWKKGLLQQMFV